MMMNPRKVAVIGCGFVGASIAFALMQKGLFSEMVLIDANHAKAEGEAMDLSHGLPYTASMDIYAGDYKDVADCGLIIITAGANQKPGETRLDLIEKNVGILKSIVPQITATAFEGILMIVANPVDVLTYAAQQISGYPVERWLRYGFDHGETQISGWQTSDVDSRRHHAVIIGEHGDSESRGAGECVRSESFRELRGRTYEASMERLRGGAR